MGGSGFFCVLLCDGQSRITGGDQEKYTVYYTHSPWRSEAWHAGPRGKTPGWRGDRRQEEEVHFGCGFLLGFLAGKTRWSRVHSLGLIG